MSLLAPAAAHAATDWTEIASAPGQIYQDDIVLDETAPRVRRATVRRTKRPRTFRLRVAAREGVSGLTGMQVTNDGRRPGPVRPFRARLTVRARSAALFVRVRDGAGNWSRWKLARRG